MVQNHAESHGHLANVLQPIRKGTGELVAAIVATWWTGGMHHRSPQILLLTNPLLTTLLLPLSHLHPKAIFYVGRPMAMLSTTQEGFLKDSLRAVCKVTLIMEKLRVKVCLHVLLLSVVFCQRYASFVFFLLEVFYLFW
jgi:hypothetical protein